LSGSGEQETGFDSRQVGRRLHRLRAGHPEIIAAAVATRSGLLLASPRDEEGDAQALAALGAALLSSADAPSEALVGGPAEEAYVRARAGYVISVSAGSGAVLTTLVAPTASIATLLPELREAAAEIGRAVAP
jgi:predicted regulator of Ras-like GTPase activity (Roadblock/LC7/MglB family)